MPVNQFFRPDQKARARQARRVTMRPTAPAPEHTACKYATCEEVAYGDTHQSQSTRHEYSETTYKVRSWKPVPDRELTVTTATQLTPADVELDAQIANLSSSDRAKLYRYAAQELRAVASFEPEEGSAAWSVACRRVLRKLIAVGQTLADIED